MKVNKIIGSWLLFLSVCGANISCKKAEVTPTPGPVTTPTTPTTPSVDTVPSMATVRTWLVDKNATNETAALFYNLKKISKTNILFGHQDDTKRGVTDANTQWANEEHITPHPSNEKSDVKEVTGAYPAVYGHDFQHIADFLSGGWFDYERDKARQLTIEAYNRGGINTYSWHYDNPVTQTDGSFYWENSKVEAVSHILPGGSKHDVFKNSLKEVADYAKTLVGANGKLVPVIFRPFHEMDGGWFWWGATHCTAEQYKQLYQFTVKYLRDDLGVRNFIYAWSPDRNFNSLSEYLQRYPGDEYVDLVGCDNYEDLKVGVNYTIPSSKLKIVSDYAISKNKVAALTETGLQNLAKTDWYTQSLLKALTNQKVEIAYVLIWANTKSAYWTPYKGHAAEADFISFKNNPYLIFSDKLKSVYEVK